LLLVVDVVSFSLATTGLERAHASPRIVLPSGKVTWTTYHGDAVVPEIRNFVISLEARHQPPRTISYYAGHSSYLRALGKSSREIMATDPTGSFQPSPNPTGSAMPG
jgi:hypothetical protein